MRDWHNSFQLRHAAADVVQSSIMCIDVFIGMCIDVFIGMCIDVFTEMCIDVCVAGWCVQACVLRWKATSAAKGRGGNI